MPSQGPIVAEGGKLLCVLSCLLERKTTEETLPGPPLYSTSRSPKSWLLSSTPCDHHREDPTVQRPWKTGRGGHSESSAPPVLQYVSSDDPQLKLQSRLASFTDEDSGAQRGRASEVTQPSSGRATWGPGLFSYTRPIIQDTSSAQLLGLSQIYAIVSVL